MQCHPKYTRQVRTAVLDELNQDYVIGAEARGVKESKDYLAVMFFRTPYLPLITMFGLSIGSLLGGTSVCRGHLFLSGTGKPGSFSNYIQ
ncbi:MAG: ABC transporter permease subunit [Blautia massiliensis (ex Durand et al. 2017)]